MSQSQLFAGICFHVQMDGDNYERAKEIRAILQNHGARYSPDPGDPRCTIIIAFPPPGAEKGVPYRYTGEEPPPRGVWDYTQICIRFARRSLSDRRQDHEADKRNTVVWSEWVYDCIGQGKILSGVRFGGWEIITKDRAPRTRAIVPAPPTGPSGPSRPSVPSVPSVPPVPALPAPAPPAPPSSSPIQGPSGHFTPPTTPSILGGHPDTSFEIEPSDSASQIRVTNETPSTPAAGHNEGVFASYTNHESGPRFFHVPEGPDHILIKQLVESLGGMVDSLRVATFVIFRLPISLADRAIIEALRPDQKAVSEAWMKACLLAKALVPSDPFHIVSNSPLIASGPAAGNATHQEPPNPPPEETIKSSVAVQPVSTPPSPPPAPIEWSFGAFASRKVRFAPPATRAPAQQASQDPPHHPPPLPRPVYAPSARVPIPNPQHDLAPLNTELTAPSVQRLPRADTSVTPIDTAKTDWITVTKDPSLADRFSQTRLTPTVLLTDTLVDLDQLSTPSETGSDADIDCEIPQPKHPRDGHSVGPETTQQIRSGGENTGTVAARLHLTPPLASPSPIAQSPTPFETPMNEPPVPRNSSSVARNTPTSGLQAAITNFNSLTRSPPIKLPGIKRKPPRPLLPGSQATRRTSQSIKEAICDSVSEAVPTLSLPKRPIIVRNEAPGNDGKGKQRQSVAAPKAPIVQPRVNSATTSNAIVIDDDDGAPELVEHISPPDVSAISKPAPASKPPITRVSATDSSNIAPPPKTSTTSRAQTTSLAIVTDINGQSDSASKGIEKGSGLVTQAGSSSIVHGRPGPMTIPVEKVELTSRGPSDSVSSDVIDNAHSILAPTPGIGTQISIPPTKTIPEQLVRVKNEPSSTSGQIENSLVVTRKSKRASSDSSADKPLLPIEGSPRATKKARTARAAEDTRAAPLPTPTLAVKKPKGKKALEDWRLDTLTAALLEWCANGTGARKTFLSALGTPIPTDWLSFYTRHRSHFVSRIPHLEAISKERRREGLEANLAKGPLVKGKKRGDAARSIGSSGLKTRPRPPLGTYRLEAEGSDEDYLGEDGEEEDESDEEEEEDSVDKGKDRKAQSDGERGGSDEDDLTPLPDDEPRLNTDHTVNGIFDLDDDFADHAFTAGPDLRVGVSRVSRRV